MTKAVKSILTAQDAPLRDLLSDALGVLSISVATVAVLWLPVILSA